MFDLISNIVLILGGILCVILSVTQIVISVANGLILPIIVFSVVGYFGVNLTIVGINEIIKRKEW